MPEVSLGAAHGVKQRTTSACLIGDDTGGTRTDAAITQALAQLPQGLRAM